MAFWEEKVVGGIVGNGECGNGGLRNSPLLSSLPNMYDIFAAALQPVGGLLGLVV
jgi:hypothetical protein